MENFGRRIRSTIDITLEEIKLLNERATVKVKGDSETGSDKSLDKGDLNSIISRWIYGRPNPDYDQDDSLE